MEAKDSINALLEQIHAALVYRGEKISALSAATGYHTLREVSRHMELLIADARTALISCHDELYALGWHLPEIPLPNAPEISVQLDEKSVKITMDAMLPYPANGSVHFLHEKLDAALSRCKQENSIPQPLFTERCAVVFIHHYEESGTAIRNMRDYDNTERRCVTNVIARHFLRDDSPACYISMDILAPGESSFTEIRMLAIPAFRELVQASEIEYFLRDHISKNVPKMYQKT